MLSMITETAEERYHIFKNQPWNFSACSAKNHRLVSWHYGYLFKQDQERLVRNSKSGHSFNSAGFDCAGVLRPSGLLESMRVVIENDYHNCSFLAMAEALCLLRFLLFYKNKQWNTYNLYQHCICTHHASYCSPIVKASTIKFVLIAAILWLHSGDHCLSGFYKVINVFRQGCIIADPPIVFIVALLY